MAIAVRPAIDGRATLVPGAAVATAVVALDGDELVVVARAADGSSPTNLGSAPLADVDLTGDSRTVLASGDAAGRRLRHGASTSGGRSPPAGSSAWPARPRRSACSTPPTASSSACPSARSRPCSTASPTSSATSTAPISSPTRRCGRSTWATPSPPRSRGWRSGSPATPPSAPGRGRSTSTAATGSWRSTTSSCTSAGPRPPACCWATPAVSSCRWPTASGPTRPPARSPARPCG